MRFFKEEFNIIQLVKICLFILFAYFGVKVYFILTKMLELVQDYVK